MPQLGLPDFGDAPSTASDDDWSTACECEANGCRPPRAPHYHRRGRCQNCPCPASSKRPESVIWERDIVLSDGAVVRANFESEYFPRVPHAEFWGAVSQTGYRSHFGLIGEGQEEGETWDEWVLAIAENHHAEFLREAKKPRKRIVESA